MPSLRGWHIPNPSELTAPQLFGLLCLWLPSSWQPGWLRFCKDLLPFSQKHFLKIPFSKKQAFFFMTEGLYIIPSTCKILLSEWGISDFQHGTPGIGISVLGLSGLLAGMWNCGAGARMLNAWVLTGLQLQSKYGFYREDTPLFNLCLTYQLNQCRLAQRRCDAVIK